MKTNSPRNQHSIIYSFFLLFTSLALSSYFAQQQQDESTPAFQGLQVFWLWTKHNLATDTVRDAAERP
jgi:hypothetical protein